MDNELAVKRLAAHDRLVTARSALRLSLERWTSARGPDGFPNLDTTHARHDARTAAAEYGNAVTEYVRLL